MSDAAAERPNKLVNELRVSGHLMTLDPGLFCIVCNPSKAADAATGLPGVRVSLPPGPLGRPDAVAISTFRPDGWMTPFGDAALVRITGAPAQILVTVYQGANIIEGGSPNLQVLRLSDSLAPPAAVAPSGQPQAAAAPAAAPAAKKVVDMIAHVQGQGDVGCMLGERIGTVGSGQWVEGFAIAPTTGIPLTEMEYQAVLGRDWLSPWVDGGQFCGSRGMALPLLGLRLRLKGAAAETFDCSYSATFVDGKAVGPVPAGEPCESPDLAALESFVVHIYPKGEAPPADPGAKPARKPAAKRK